MKNIVMQNLVLLWFYCLVFAAVGWTKDAAAQTSSIHYNGCKFDNSYLPVWVT